MTTQFERLKAGFAITLGGQLMPGAGAYSIGAVAVVMPDETSAREWVDEHREDLASLDRGPANIAPVGDPWRFMRRAAGEGLAGIEAANRDAFPVRFMFMVRVEEAGATLPTVMASMTENGWDKCLTRTGVKRFEHAEVLHWQRFDILDRVTGEWGQNCPFREWNYGDVLYELRSDNVVVLLANVPLMGDWNSTQGAFAFFTSKEMASHYLEHHLGDGRNRMLIYGGNESIDSHEAMASIEAVAVNDLRDRLIELARINHLAAWCINPDSSRENASFGRLFHGGTPPIFADQKDVEVVPTMGTVGGIWTVQSGNHFEMLQATNPWTGTDTIRWSGGQSIQLCPLDRSFEVDEGFEGIDANEDWTESEAEELLGHHLDSVSLEDCWNRLTEPSATSKRLSEFHIVCWDSVTGEGRDLPWRFDSFSQALTHLAAFEREHDRHHRKAGAASCGHIGFTGSGNSHFEDLRSTRFRLGLRRLALRVLRKGYRPQDAADLVALCNGTLGTLHVEFAGFAKDLLWASSSGHHDALLEELEIDETSWLEWSESTEVFIDPIGQALLIERMGEGHFKQLLPKVRHFLSTALVQLNEQGSAPQLDYAPISIEVVKALEVELSGVLKGFCHWSKETVYAFDEESHAEASLMTLLKGGKAPTLGTIPHLLKSPTDDASQLYQALHAYLNELPNKEFLCANRFVKKGLQRVIHKFRNGGAHDSPISEAVCRECVDVLIGTPENPGYIPNVVQWRASIGSALSD